MWITKISSTSLYFTQAIRLRLFFAMLPTLFFFMMLRKTTSSQKYYVFIKIMR